MSTAYMTSNPNAGSDIDIAIKVVNGDKSGCETFDIMRKVSSASLLRDTKVYLP